MKNYKYVILFLVAFGNFLACFTQYQTGSLSTQLINGFSLTSGEFARLTTAQMIPTIFLSIFVGTISDRLGSKKTILIGLTITVISLFLKLNAKSYLLLFITCMGCGLTGTFLNTINSKMINAWFSKEELGVMMGLIQAALSIGQVLALALSGACTYQFIFKISFVMGAILLVLWIIFAKDSDKEIKANKKVNLIDGINDIETVFIGLILFSLFGGFGTISSFLPSKLIANNVAGSLAGQITSITALARLFGSLTFPTILRKTNNEKSLIISLLSVFPILLFLLAITNSQLLISIVVFLIGYIVGGLAPIFFKMPLTIDRISQDNIGAACGLVSTLQILGAVLVPSYICASIAGSNYFLLYCIGAIVSLFALICYLLLQRQIKKYSK